MLEVLQHFSNRLPNLMLSCLLQSILLSVPRGQRRLVRGHNIAADAADGPGVDLNAGGRGSRVRLVDPGIELCTPITIMRTGLTRRT